MAGMLRRRQHHVDETPEHVRPNRLALVAAGERRHEDLRADRHAQVIRPERDEPLDERTRAGDALGERGTAFGGGNRDEAAARLLAGLVALPRGAERADGLFDRVRRGFCRRPQQ